MKNKLTRSVNTFLMMVLSVSVLVPSLGYAKMKGIDPVQTVFERTSAQDLEKSFRQTEQTKAIHNTDKSSCAWAARKGRCHQPIQYQSTTLGKVDAETSNCQRSARKGRCGHAIQYKSAPKLQMAGANPGCEWSARKGRCNKPFHSTSAPKLKIAAETSQCQRSARQGRCNQPISYRSSMPEVKVANAQCRWSARSGRCGKSIEASGGLIRHGTSGLIELSASGQCELSARNGRCSRVNLPKNLNVTGQASNRNAAN